MLGGRSATTWEEISLARCDECATAAEIAVRAEHIVIDVRGNACAACAPDATNRRSARGEDRVAEPAVVRAWWSYGNAGEQRWKAVLQSHRVEEVQRTRTFDRERAEPAAESEPTVAVWRQVLTEAIDQAFADETWLVLSEVWQAGYCGIVEGLGTVVEAFWNEVVVESEGAARIVIRLTGLPPATALLLREVVFGPQGTAEADGSMIKLAALCRDFGALLCASGGNVTGCPEVRHRLGTVAELPTPESFEALGGPRVVRALTSTSDAPTLARLLGEPRIPEPVRIAKPVPESVGHVENLGAAPAESRPPDVPSPEPVPAEIRVETGGGGAAPESIPAETGVETGGGGAAPGLVAGPALLGATQYAPSAPSTFGRR